MTYATSGEGEQREADVNLRIGGTMTIKYGRYQSIAEMAQCAQGTAADVLEYEDKTPMETVEEGKASGMWMDPNL